MFNSHSIQADESGFQSIASWANLLRTDEEEKRPQTKTFFHLHIAIAEENIS